MDYVRRPIVAPPSNVQGYYPVPDSIQEQRNRQFGHQPIGSNNYAQDDAALNLESVFVNARSQDFRQQQSGYGIPPSQQQYPTETVQPGSFNRLGRETDFQRNRQMNSGAKDDYYDPMYPTVGTPTGVFGSGSQVFGDKSYTNNDGRGIVYSSNERGPPGRPGPRQIHLSSTVGSSQSQSQNISLGQSRQLQTILHLDRSNDEFIDQFRLGSGQDSHVQPDGSRERPSNMFLRTGQVGGGPLGPLRLGGYATDENLQRAIRGFPNSELNAIALSLNTDVIKSSSDREVVPKPTYLNLPKPDRVANSIFSKNTYFDTTSNKSLGPPRTENKKMINSTTMNSNEGKIPRFRVFTDVVTAACDDYGFVGSDVFFQTSAVSGTNKPRVGDQVLVEAEFVEGMQFKWNGKKVEVIGRITQHDSIANLSESRSLSPSHYFSDVLTVRPNTSKILDSLGHNFSTFANDVQKPYRNPPPPPNISQQRVRTHSHSSSRRRSRSRSRSKSREGRNYRRGSRDYERGHSSPRNSGRRSRSRSVTPESYRRRSSTRELSAERERQRKLVAERNRPSFEELVFSDRRKQEIPQKKTFTNVPADLRAADVFKVATISKKVSPSINILPLRSALSSRVKANNCSEPSQATNLAVPPSSAKPVRVSDSVSRNLSRDKIKARQILKGNDASAAISGQSGAQNTYQPEGTNSMTRVAGERRSDPITLPTVPKPRPGNKGGDGSDQTIVTQVQNIPNMNSSMILRNPAYRGNISEIDKTVPQNTSTDSGVNSGKGISIRLGFIEAKKQQDERQSREQVDTSKAVDDPQFVVSATADFVEAVERNNLNPDKMKRQNKNSGRHSSNSSAAIKSSVTEETLRAWEDERRSMAKTNRQTTTIMNEEKGENIQNQEPDIRTANRTQKGNTGKESSKETQKKIENIPRRVPAKEDKGRGTKTTHEIKEKEKEKKEQRRNAYNAYNDRVKLILSKKKEIGRHRDEIRRNRKRDAGHSSRHDQRHRTHRSPKSKVRMEPVVQMVPLVDEEIHFESHRPEFDEARQGFDPVEPAFVSEAEIIEREQELERREKQLIEEQLHLEARMEELETANKLKLMSPSPPRHHYIERRVRSRSPGYYDTGYSSPIVSGGSVPAIYRERRRRTNSPSYKRGDHDHSRSSSPNHQRRHLRRNRRPRSKSPYESDHHRGKRSRTPPHVHPSYPREGSPEIAYFRIDRRSPGRITPENRDNFCIRGPSGNDNQMPWSASGNSDVGFGGADRYRDVNEAFRADLDYDLNERRRRADEELMSEELGEEERRIFRGDFEPAIPFVPFPTGIPIPIEMQMQLPYESAQRFVWAPDESMERPGGPRKKPKVPKPSCQVCGKKGHLDSDCWHRSKSHNYT